MVDVLNEYLSKLAVSPAKSVGRGTVEWNKQHAEEALPIGNSSLN